MDILYLSQYFPPEVGASQARAYEMAHGLVRAGHRVTLIAELPNHPHGVMASEHGGKLYERTELDGIDVIRVWVRASPVKSFRNRIAFYLSYMFMAALACLLLARGRYDVIYATSPPLPVGGAALIASYLRRIPLVFEVRDLWPQVAVELGVLKNPHAIHLAERLAWHCYRRARKIVVVTEGIRQRLVAAGVPASKLALIPNGANTELFQPQPAAGAALRTELKLDGAFVVLYAGLHGIAQGMELLLDVACCLRDAPDIQFLFVGEGPAKVDLMRRAHALALPNVRFHAQVPRERMPAFFSMAQLALVPLRKLPLFKDALPVKLFDAWACACPTLVAIDGEAKALLQRAEAGCWIEPEDVGGLAGAILGLYENPEQLPLMGEHGRRFVIKHYSRQMQALQLCQLLQQVVG